MRADQAGTLVTAGASEWYDLRQPRSASRPRHRPSRQRPENIKFGGATPWVPLLPIVASSKKADLARSWRGV